MTGPRAPAWAVASALLAAGCATLAAPRARERELDRQLEAWRSPAALDGAWLEARRLLAERGYPLADGDADAVSQPRMPLAERLLTPARATVTRGPLERSLDTGWTRARERMRLESGPTAAGWRIRFLRVDEGSGERPGRPARDVELELALVRRLDPAGAARIDAALSDPVATRP